MSNNAPLNTLHLQALSRNNANASSHFNELMWVLEWAEWSLVLRQKIFDCLKNILNNNNLIVQNWVNHANVITWISTIRQAVSYVAWILNAWNTEQERNNAIISKIEEEVLKKEDLSESAIIRLSALNRFQIELSPEETLTLHKVEKKLNDILWESVPTMINSSWNRWETNAQRIQRITEQVNYLIKNWLLTELPEWYKELSEKLKPLRELDVSYHELNHARNMFYDIQNRVWEIQVLSQTEEKKLEVALNTLTQTNLETYYDQNIRKKWSKVDLNAELDKIKASNPDIAEKIKSLNLSVWDFDRYFLFHFSTKILKRAKTNFEMKKIDVFSDKRRDFEADVKTWREIQRNRVLELCNNPAWNLQVLNDIFSRDRKLFLRTWDAQRDALLVDWLREIVQNRYSTIPAATQQQLVDAILDENEATNRLYYWSETTLFDDKNDNWAQPLFKVIWNAWRNIQKVSEYTTPVMNIFVKSIKWIVEGVWWKLWQAITSTAKWIHDWLWWYNEWANKWWNWFFGSIGKFPFYASQVITRPLRMVTWSVNLVASEWVWIVSWTYNWINWFLKNAWNKEIESMFDLLTQAYKHSVRLTWKWVEFSWDKVFDVLKTGQKREILREFYRTRNEKDVNNLLECIDINSRLADSSPYIFDVDAFDDYGFQIVKKASNDNIKKLWAKVKALIDDLNWWDIDWTNKAIWKEVKRIFANVKKKVDAWDDEWEILLSFRTQITKFIVNVRSSFISIDNEIQTLTWDLWNINNQINQANWQQWWNNNQRWQKNDIKPLVESADKIREQIKAKNTELAELARLWIDSANPQNIRAWTFLDLLDKVAWKINNDWTLQNDFASELSKLEF